MGGVCGNIDASQGKRGVGLKGVRKDLMLQAYNYLFVDLITHTGCSLAAMHGVACDCSIDYSLQLMLWRGCLMGMVDYFPQSSSQCHLLLRRVVSPSWPHPLVGAGSLPSIYRGHRGQYQVLSLVADRQSLPQQEGCQGAFSPVLHPSDQLDR